MLEVNFDFRISKDNTLEGNGGLLLPLSLQAGARDKTVPVGAPILKGWSPPLAPNSHLVLNEDGLGGLEVGNTAVCLNEIGGVSGQDGEVRRCQGPRGHEGNDFSVGGADVSDEILRIPVLPG